MSKSPYSLNKFASQMCQNGIPYDKWQDAFEEKRLLKQLSNIFSVSLIVQVASSVLVSGAVVVFIMVLKYAAQLYFPAIYNSNKPVIENALTLYMYITYMFVAFAVMAFMLKKNPLKAINARRIEKPALIIPAVIISLLFYSLGIIATTLIELYMALLHLKTQVPAFTMPTQPIAMVLYIITICVCAPLIEEFIFRGLVLQSLRKFGDVFAIVMSALLFGLMHGNLLQSPFAFVTALAFGYFVIKLNTIWVSVISHCIINSSSVAIELVQKQFGEKYINTLSLLIFAGILIFSALSILILIKVNFFNKYKLNNPSILPFRMKFKAVISAPGFIVFASAVLTEIILTTRII
jgi:membrane protease YdiL (CAAX protease family)